MKYPHIITNKSIVAFVNGKQYSCSNESLRYKQVIQALKENDEEGFKNAIMQDEIEALNKETVNAGFVLVNGVATLDGVEVIGSLQAKLVRMIREGLAMSGFVAFVRKLRKNPSRSAVKELYDFLSYAELPITESGNLIAYKGVQDSYWSVRSGNTVLSEGKVENGCVFNGIGEVIRCERVEVDDDRRNGCSNGLHVGSHDYATGWGNRTVVVEIDPADVVSVPLDCEFQKMRVCGYKVIADYDQEIKEALVDEQYQGVKSNKESLLQLVDERVKSLSKRGGPITLKRLQSALSPFTPSVYEIKDALTEIGYSVCVDPSNKTSVGSMFVVW